MCTEETLIDIESICIEIFVCKKCLIDVKKDNPNYTYGGTWKR